MLIVTFLCISLTQVSATALITPSTTTAMLDFPTTFKVTGLDDENTYSVTVDGASTLTGLLCTTSGELMFDITVSTAGNHAVRVLDNTSAVVATANVNGYDVLAILIPSVVVLIGVTLVLGIVKEVKL